MKYLFFDIECANCWENKGKICSFGYVLIDEKFNVLEKKDIIINPRAKFDYKGLAMGGIKLAYTPRQYKKAPTFDKCYDQIVSIITQKDCVVFGHSTSSDAKYLLDECQRYNKPFFDFVYVDTIKLLRLIYDRNKDLSLSVLYKEFYPQSTQLLAHKSDDDAFMTMKIAQHICEDKDITISQLISQNTLAKGEVFMGRIVDKDATIFNYSQVSNKTRNSNNRVFEQAKIEQLPAKSGVFASKNINLEHGYECNNFAQMLLIINRLNKQGGKYVSNAAHADIYVTKSGRKNRYLPSSALIMSFNEFIKKLSLNKQQLLTQNINCDELIGEFLSNQNWYGEYKKTHVILPKIDNFLHGGNFECSVDFPVIQYECQAQGEKTKKLYRFYDPVLQGIFARHPYRVNRACNSYLPPQSYEKAQSESQGRVIKNLKRNLEDKDTVINILQTYNYIVSYKFLGKFDGHSIKFTLLNKIIADSDFEKSIKINKKAINIDLKDALLRYYDEKLLAKALSNMSKFRFGYKNKDIIVEPILAEQLQVSDKIHLPKRYFEECQKLDFVPKSSIISSQNAIFIPTTASLENNLFDNKITLPIVIERSID